MSVSSKAPERLSPAADVPRDRICLHHPGGTLTYGDLSSHSQQLQERWLRAGRRSVALGLASPPADWTIPALIALERLQADVFLLDGDLDEDRNARLLERFGVDFAVNADGRVLASAAGGGRQARGRIVLLTSGTTGEPKAVEHTWQSLAAGIQTRESLRDSRWLLTYALSRYAGLQVLLTCLENGAELVVPPDRTIAGMLDACRRHAVSHVSGTPTFWRMFLSSMSAAVRSELCLRQITLGGEIADQTVLNALTRAFPGARVTHIFAASEAGVCFSVHDGRAGFPASLAEGDNADLRIEGGTLRVRSRPGAMRGYRDDAAAAGLGDWWDTGDAVERRGDRVFFLGRRSERINVGGLKIYPAQVESVIRDVPQVRLVRVRGRDSSIAGQLVQADVVAERDSDVKQLREAIREVCESRLQSHMRPRIIRFLPELAAAESGKIVRGAHRG